jgi:hypothetical protein
MFVKDKIAFINIQNKPDSNAISISDAADGLNVYRAITVSDALLCRKVEGYYSNTVVSTIALSPLVSAVGTRKNYLYKPVLQNEITISRLDVFVPDFLPLSFDKNNIKHKN